MGRYPLDLRGVAAKLDRAAGHIATLDQEIADFRAAHPITTFTEHEGGTTFLVKVRVPETPDLRWGVVLGDAIHDLRSALDHAVWELVQRNVRAGFKPAPTEAQERRITYPIASKRADFYGSTAVRFMTTRQVKFVRRFQPYLRPWPEATPFGELGWLSNIDKHRVVHATHVALESWKDFKLRCRSNLLSGRMTTFEPLIAAGARLTDGEAIVRLAWEVSADWSPATRKDPWAEVKGEFKSEIRFGEGRPIPSSELSRLHALIRERMRTLELRLG